MKLTCEYCKQKVSNPCGDKNSKFYWVFCPMKFYKKEKSGQHNTDLNSLDRPRPSIPLTKLFKNGKIIKG